MASSARDAPDLDAEAEVDLGRYSRALLARWWLLLVGLVVGAVVGYLTTLGGTQFYRAQAVVYMGQPLGAGQAPLQSLNTNPSTARAIVTSESAVRRVAAKTGMTPDRIRSGTSVTAVQGSVPKLGQTPLIQITVKAPTRGQVARAANALATQLAFQLSSGARQKIAIYQQQVDADNAGLKIVNDALAKSDLSTTEKILLQGRLQTLQSDKTLDGAAAHLREDGRGRANRHVRRAGEVVRAQPPQLHRRRRADRADPRRHRGAALGSDRPGAPQRSVTRVSFIVPAYNEASTIAEVLERVEALDLDKQIVVVDDGSTDETPRVLEQWAGRNGIQVVRQENRGKGAAIRAAIRCSTATSS